MKSTCLMWCNQLNALKVTRKFARERKQVGQIRRWKLSGASFERSNIYASGARRTTNITRFNYFVAIGNFTWPLPQYKGTSCWGGNYNKCDDTKLLYSFQNNFHLKRFVFFH